MLTVGDRVGPSQGWARDNADNPRGRTCRAEKAMSISTQIGTFPSPLLAGLNLATLATVRAALSSAA